MLENNKETANIMVYKDQKRGIHEIVIFDDMEFETWLAQPHVMDDGWQTVNTDITVTVPLKTITRRAFKDVETLFKLELENVKKKLFENSLGVSLILANDSRIKHKNCFFNSDLLDNGIVTRIPIQASSVKDCLSLVTKQQTTIFIPDPIVNDYEEVDDEIVDQEDLFDE